MIDLVQQEIINARKRGNRKPSTAWGRLRAQAQKLRRLARRRGCQGKRHLCMEYGFQAARLEADAAQAEREWNLDPANYRTEISATRN
jgi:hypothetical protein